MYDLDWDSSCQLPDLTMPFKANIFTLRKRKHMNKDDSPLKNESLLMVIDSELYNCIPNPDAIASPNTSSRWTLVTTCQVPNHKCTQAYDTKQKEHNIGYQYFLKHNLFKYVSQIYYDIFTFTQLSCLWYPHLNPSVIMQHPMTNHRQIVSQLNLEIHW